MSDDRRRYENDVFYDVWRSGGDPDAIDYEAVSDDYYNNVCHDEAADYELIRQRRPLVDF